MSMLPYVTAALGFAALLAAGFSKQTMTIRQGRQYRIKVRLDENVGAEAFKAQLQSAGAQFIHQDGNEITFIMTPGTDLQVSVPAPLPGSDGVTISSVEEV